MGKKVLINLKSVSGKISGTGFFTLNFLDTLKEIENIDLYGVVDEVDNEQIETISKLLKNKFLVFNKRVKKRLTIFLYKNFIEKIINNFNIDVYIEPGNLLLIKKKNITNKTKIITVIHDIFPITNPNYTPKIYNKYFSYFMKNTVKNTDRYIFVSNATKNSVESYFSKINFDKKSMILYNDISHLMNKEVNKKEIKNQNYFLYIGNLERRKGVDILLNSFLKYCESNGNKKLILAGSIREKKIEKKISYLKKRCEQKFDYLGRVSEEEKQQLLKNCSAFVFPSRAEGFGIPPMEALLYNKPIILSNLDVFKEIYGNIPIYFNLGNNASDNLYKILTSFKYNEKIISKSFFEKFNMKNQLRNLINFLE